MNKIMIIATGIIILLVIAGFTGMLPLSIFDDGEYHTGFSNSDVNNCETKHLKTGCFSLGGCWHGNIMKDYSELIFSPHNNAPIVTSMRRGIGERSIEVVVQGNLVYDSLVSHWTPERGWYEVEINEGSGWKRIINTKDGQVNDDIVAFVSGSTSKQKYYDRSGEVIIPGLTFSTIKILNPIGFSLKGPHVGILRVRQKTEFSASLGLQKETHTTSEDYAFLISGKGEVDLVGDRTRFIAGVDTVKFIVDTGYSGYTTGGEYTERGWELKVYDNFGNLKKTWDIGDDKQGCRYDKQGNVLNYPIPSDAVVSGESHTWTVVLTNTLFEQDFKTWFAITKEELRRAPDIKPIKFGEDEYNMGETVTIYLEGIPNPEGLNTINGFLVIIRYGGLHGMDIVEDYDGKYISATGNTATISFRTSKGDTYIGVEAWAFDYPESQGGIMSEKAQATVWIKDKKHRPVEIDWMPLIFAVITFIVFLAIGLLVPVPWQIKIIIIVIGLIVAYLVYYYFSSL